MVLFKREFLLNIVFLFVANLLIKPYYIFFIERDFQNQVGTSSWGIYFTLFSLSMMPQILLDFGLTSYINRRVASQRIDSDLIFRQTLWLRPLFALVFSVAFLLLTWSGGYLSDFPELVFWIALNQILLSGILYFRAFISGLGHYRTDSLFSVSDKLLFILLVIFAAIFFPLNQLRSYLIIQFISLVIPFLAALAWIRFKIKPRWKGYTFSIPFQILKDCFPFAGVFILMVLFSRLEPVWIDLLRSDGAVQSGIYAAAYRLLDAANMLGFLFAGLLLPMFSNALAQKNAEACQSLFDLAWKLMTSSAVLIALPLAFYHRYVMQVLYVDDHPDVLYILILNLIPLTINYLLSTLLTAAGLARTMNRLFVVSILINTGGHMIFTGRYGALGASFTALITQSITALLLAGVIIHQKLVVIRWTHLSGLLASVIITALCGWAVTGFGPEPGPGFIFCIVFNLTVFLLLDLLPVRSIYHMVFRTPQS